MTPNKRDPNETAPPSLCPWKNIQINIDIFYYFVISLSVAFQPFCFSVGTKLGSVFFSILAMWPIFGRKWRLKIAVPLFFQRKRKHTQKGQNLKQN